MISKKALLLRYAEISPQELSILLGFAFLVKNALISDAYLMPASLNQNLTISAVLWEADECRLLDQTKLPAEETYLRCRDYREVISAIKSLAVRGAPALGVAGAYAAVLAARRALCESVDRRRYFLANALTEIAEARPTAVNLKWAVERQRALLGLGDGAVDAALVERLIEQAKQIHDDDVRANQTMAELGLSLFSAPGGVITYCNTGSLATGGIGTAFGVIHFGYLNNKVTHVFPCETRPVGQGLRLTVWELNRHQIPYTLICDNMAGMILRDEKISAVFVGADRIAANGDAANKVGTYSLAVLANYHKVPFYVVAPSSTFDLSIASGKEIPIEHRSAEEILSVLGERRHHFDVPTRNPSFDVTPAELITAIVCERGVITAPTTSSVGDVVGRNS